MLDVFGEKHLRSNSCTAVVLSATPKPGLRVPGVETLVHVSRFKDAAGLLEQRLVALQKVKTEWFFFLDDDDTLPPDFLEILELCTSAGTPVAYTNETINGVLRKSAPYSQEAHLKNALFLHHLVVCRTDTALRAAKVIPSGTYGVEPLLFFQAAKEGATWIDRVGYVWTPKPTGLAQHPTLTRGLVRSLLWMRDHRN